METDSVLDQKLPSLNVVRLTGDEVEFRPIPLVGEMAETSSAAVAKAVGVRQSGPYNSFTLTPESAGQEFVVSEASWRHLYLPGAGTCNDLNLMGEGLYSRR